MTIFSVVLICVIILSVFQIVLAIIFYDFAINTRKDRTKQLYTNGDIDTYLKNEVTDVKDIVALENLRKQSADNMSASKAVAINSKKDQIGEDPSKMTTKKRKEWKETFAKDFKDRGVSDSRAKEGSDKLMKDVSTLYKIRKKL